MPRSPILLVLALLLVAASAAPLSGAAAAPEPQSDRSGVQGPPEVAPAIRSVLQPGVTVEADGVPVTVWPVRRLEPRDGTAAGLGVVFTGIAPGALLGAVRFGGTWTGYRGQRVEAGLYTLRYAVEPEDGYHMGVSFYRDFAILVPAELDDGEAVQPEERLLAFGAVSAGGTHPAVLALWPADGNPRGTLFDNDLGQPTLVVTADGVTLGLVLSGTGEV